MAYFNESRLRYFKIIIQIKTVTKLWINQTIYRDENF
jgi:hypothetical protein